MELPLPNSIVKYSKEIYLSYVTRTQNKAFRYSYCKSTRIFKQQNNIALLVSFQGLYFATIKWDRNRKAGKEECSPEDYVRV